MKNPPLTVNKIKVKISTYPGLANRALNNWALVGEKNAGLHISVSMSLVILFKLNFLPFLMQKKE